ncbi:RHS repeat-associated core domain-containing protein [Dongshaea marina]|uniref:RHS repeat-associated core domain-containing protein n=1 Tax=Dongshaea marina TaxID=2047966 RepID=UPI00131F2568|nr:RHS repeat-associated core domain-containing protein [Dongshaea marina]
MSSFVNAVALAFVRVLLLLGMLSYSSDLLSIAAPGNHVYFYHQNGAVALSACRSNAEKHGVSCHTWRGPQYYFYVPGIDYEENHYYKTPDELDPPLKSNGQTCLAAGNPIDIATGNKFQREVDLTSGGPDPLVVGRNYNSSNGLWRFDYFQKIEMRSDPAEVWLRRGDGKTFIYRNTGSSWQSDADVYHKLEQSIEGYDWRLTLQSGGAEYYDSKGRLLRVIDAQGRIKTLSHDDLGVTVQNGFGKSLRFEYGSHGMVQLVRLNGELTLSYQYDDWQRLIAVTYPDGTQKQYHYHPTQTALLTGITDERGVRFASWEYDAEGRAILSEHAGQERTKLSYNQDGSTTVTNALGKETTYHFTEIETLKRVTRVDGHASAHCLAASKEYGYYDNGLAKTKTDWQGNVTRFEYNERGLISLQVEAEGTAEERRTHWLWDPLKPLAVSKIQGDHVLSYGYDLSGRLIRLQHSTGGTWQYSYNSQGLLATADGPRSDIQDITRYQYDADGNLTEALNPAGHSWRFGSYTVLGKPGWSLDPNGIQTLYRYDSLGRILSSKKAGELTHYSYDLVGQLAQLITPDGLQTRFSYDDARRLTTVIYADGSQLLLSYDAQGNIVQQQLISAAGVVSRQRAFRYDEMSRLLGVILEQGEHGYRYDLNSNPISGVDGIGHEHFRAYDALNRLINHQDEAGGVTRLSYNQQDAIILVTAPNNAATSYSYDGLGNRTHRASPDTGTTSYQYDDAGNLTLRTDSLGRQESYRYDALNRLIERKAGSSVTHYQYDETEPGQYGIGHLTGLNNASSELSFSYDAHGRLTEQSHKYLLSADAIAHQFNISYAYASGGKLTQLTLPENNRVQNRYDAFGRIQAIEFIGSDGIINPVVSNIEYDAAGGITAMVWGNGTQEIRNYNRDGRLTYMSIPGVTDLSYRYDANGNLLEIGENSYSYDMLNRLTGEKSLQKTLSYSYDAVGNRRERSGEGGSSNQILNYQVASNRLVSQDGKAVSLDELGRLLTTFDDKELQYNQDGRLSSIPAANVEYRYNGLGQRILKLQQGTAKKFKYWQCRRQAIREFFRSLKTEHWRGFRAKYQSLKQSLKICKQKRKEYRKLKRQGGLKQAKTTSYAYDLHGQLIAEYSEEQGYKFYLWLGSRPVAMVQIIQEGDGFVTGPVTYLHTDHLNTPRWGTDSKQQLVWRWQSDAFGVGEAHDPHKLNINLRFPGQYYDSETGLHYNYHRYYDPETGRYITSDPIGLVGGVNTYGYALGNSINLSDPYGLCPWCVVGAVISGGINAYSQYQENKGFNNFNWVDFLGSTATGALGGGLGTLASRLTWRAAGSTWQLSTLGQVAVNSIGSSAIGAGVASIQNRLNGRCSNVSGAAINGLIVGVLGAGLGSGISKIIKSLNHSKYNALPLEIRLLYDSNALHGVRRPVFIPGGVTFGNSIGSTVSNMNIYEYL